MKTVVNPPALANNIRKLRKKQHLSLDDLSRRSGVSKAMLSQIEGDKVNPTIATVWKIACGLGLDLQELLQADENGRFDIHRRDRAVVLDYDEGRCRIQVVAPHRFVEDQEIYIIHLQQGGILISEPHFPQTEELLTVLSGKMEVVSGEHCKELEAWDSAHYNADVRHSIRNLGQETASAYMLVRFKREQ